MRLNHWGRKCSQLAAPDELEWSIHSRRGVEPTCSDRIADNTRHVDRKLRASGRVRHYPRSFRVAGCEDTLVVGLCKHP